jgi:hypothetical protein
MHRNVCVSFIVSIAVASGLIIQVCDAQVSQRPSSPESRLRSSLQAYLEHPPPQDFAPTSYSFSFVNLARQGKNEAIVYLTGREWCGSGGCHMLVLAQKDASYKVIARIPGVRLPIRVLNDKSQGWHDLSVWIQGGGIIRGYEARVRFDGTTYIEESQASGEARTQKSKGEIVLSSKDKVVPLYP